MTKEEALKIVLEALSEALAQAVVPDQTSHDKELPRYSPDGKGGMEVDSLGEWINVSRADRRKETND